MTNENNKIIANPIKKIRIMNDLTQKEMSDSLGICQNYYNRVEKGKLKISIKFAVKFIDLYCNDDKLKEEFIKQYIYSDNVKINFLVNNLMTYEELYNLAKLEIL